MKALIQRVTRASVLVDNKVLGQIGPGLLVLFGVKKGDTHSHASQLAEKIVNLRIFENDEGKFDFSCLDKQLEILAVSQFTLYADTAKGRRPSFIEAEEPQKADELYQFFVQELKKTGLNIQTGQFQAHMHVELTNDGPVTIMVEV